MTKKQDPKSIAWGYVTKFARCANYPKEDGVEALVDGIVEASRRTGIAIPDLVAKCVTTSQWCPTDADLLAVARDMRASTASAAPQPPKQAEWEALYGPPVALGDRVQIPDHRHNGKLLADIAAEAGERWLKFRNLCKTRGLDQQTMHQRDRNGLMAECGITVTPEMRREAER